MFRYRVAPARKPFHLREAFFHVRMIPLPVIVLGSVLLLSPSGCSKSPLDKALTIPPVLPSPHSLTICLAERTCTNFHSHRGIHDTTQ